MRVIIQAADTGPVESLMYMFNSLGIECLLPSERLLGIFRSMKLSTIISRTTLEESWGYSPVQLPFRIAEESDLNRMDTILVDVKGHVNYKSLVKRYPKLANRILWYRINGGEPENVPGKGEELNPPCPIITPNQWYESFSKTRAYVFWPKLVNSNNHLTHRDTQIESEILASKYAPYLPPISLVHNIEGWGFAKLIPDLESTGLKLYGVRSRDGVISNIEARQRLKRSVAMIHLKSSDAPGYAIYEAIDNGCPIIVSRRLIWRNKMQKLLIPQITCLVFDRETHEELTPKDIESCTKEIKQGLSSLMSPITREILTKEASKVFNNIQWSSSDPENVRSLQEFLRFNFS